MISSLRISRIVSSLFPFRYKTKEVDTVHRFHRLHFMISIVDYIFNTFWLVQHESRPPPLEQISLHHNKRLNGCTLLETIQQFGTINPHQTCSVSRLGWMVGKLLLYLGVLVTYAPYGYGIVAKFLQHFSLYLSLSDLMNVFDLFYKTVLRSNWTAMRAA